MDRKEYVGMYGEEFVQSAEKLTECSQQKDSSVEVLDEVRHAFNNLAENLTNVFHTAIASVDWSGILNILDLYRKDSVDCAKALHLGLVDRWVVDTALGEHKVHQRTINKNMNRVRKELRLHQKRSTLPGHGKCWIKKGQTSESSMGVDNTTNMALIPDNQD